MSTDLKSRSKAYTLTRVALRGLGNVGLSIGQGYNKVSITLSLEEAKDMFVRQDFYRLDMLNLLEETVERLKLDVYQFAMTGGAGMEEY